MELIARIDSGQYPVSQLGYYELYVIADGQLRERPHGLDIEGGHGVDNGTGK